MMLKIHGLKKNYGNYRALAGLDLEIAEGTLYGLIGPNGAGKTTTIRIITGLLAPDDGTVHIAGIDARKRSRQIRSYIGYVPDYFGIYDNLKVWEYMEFFAACYGLEGLSARKRGLTLLEQVGLDGREDSYVDSLSRGMQQRLCLARALLHDPPLLVMDEPTAGLDPHTRLEFREIVRELNEQGKTILISSHLLSDLSELCTDIGIIDEGRMLLHGSVEELVNQVRTARPLVITFCDDPAAALPLLKDHPLVRTISVREREIMVGFTGSARQESELLAALTAQGIAVRGFMREPGSLEAVFMQLTKHDEEKVVLAYEDESGL